MLKAFRSSTYHPTSYSATCGSIVFHRMKNPITPSHCSCSLTRLRVATKRSLCRLNREQIRFAQQTASSHRLRVHQNVASSERARLGGASAAVLSGRWRRDSEHSAAGSDFECSRHSRWTSFRWHPPNRGHVLLLRCCPRLLSYKWKRSENKVMFREVYIIPAINTRSLQRRAHFLFLACR